MQICMQKEVKVDGKVRTDLNYPAGFMGEYVNMKPGRGGNTINNLSVVLRQHIPDYYPIFPAVQIWCKSLRLVTNSGFCTTQRADLSCIA